MNFSHLANKLRNKITKFSGIVSKDLDKTAQRFIKEAIYGIIASQSVMLSEIGRQLESSISLKKTEERFSRQLIKSDIWSHLHKQVLKLASHRIKERTLLILDLSDLKKKYAEKMEYLAKVRDGSENGEIIDGYWTTQVVASDVNNHDIVPLYMALFSQNSPDFISENEEILKAVDQVSNAVNNKGIWVIDRGGDRDILFNALIRKQRDFIIRMIGNRNVIHNGRTIKSLWLALKCKLPYSKSIIKVVHGKEVMLNLKYGFVPVKLPDRETPLNMIVVKGFGYKPMMLLTTIPVTSKEKDIWFIVQAYIKRWSIEESIRFVKQTYDLENIRVLKYTRLQNMMALLLAVFFFVAVILDQSQKLMIMAGHILKSAKRIFGIPDFRYYAISDGMRNIFSHYPGKLNKIKEIRDLQLCFEFG